MGKLLGVWIIEMLFRYVYMNLISISYHVFPIASICRT